MRNRRLLHAHSLGLFALPLLAAAHAGIAMGGAGSDLTMTATDAIVIRDDLTTIPAVIALSRRVRRVVVANLVIAATFIAALVIWGLAGHLPLPLGVAGHEGSTVIVGLNGLRLLRRSAWNRALRAGSSTESSTGSGRGGVSPVTWRFRLWSGFGGRWLG
jgi:hypothetical protein